MDATADTGNGSGSRSSMAAPCSPGRAVVVLSGAGISTDSGIPDFRGPEGVWTKNPSAEKLATLQAYVSDPALRRQSWQRRLTSPVWASEPNAGHRALVDLEHSGRLDTLVTQNIDGLHQMAGTDPALVVEIHGTARDVVCLRCGDRQPAGPVHDRVRAGEHDPACTALDDRALRGHPQVGHHQLRSEPGTRGSLAGRAGGGRVRPAGGRRATLAVFPAAGLVPSPSATVLGS